MSLPKISLAEAQGMADKLFEIEARLVRVEDHLEEIAETFPSKKEFDEIMDTLVNAHITVSSIAHRITEGINSQE